MTAKKKAKSLRAFAGVRRTADCKVCALPADVIKQIRGRDTKNIKLAVVLAWLRQEYGVAITEQQYTKHSHGGHERLAR